MRALAGGGDLGVGVVHFVVHMHASLFASRQFGAGVVRRKADLERCSAAADLGEGLLQARAAVVIGGRRFVEEGEQASLHDGEALEGGVGIEDCVAGRVEVALSWGWGVD